MRHAILIEVYLGVHKVSTPLHDSLCEVEHIHIDVVWGTRFLDKDLTLCASEGNLCILEWVVGRQPLDPHDTKALIYHHLACKKLIVNTRSHSFDALVPVPV